MERESLQSKEDYINSFLDRLEGETLGRMMDYLSSELTNSATMLKARDMLEDQETASGDVDVVRQQEQEHIFAEIVKVGVITHIVNVVYIVIHLQVTQTTVDRYLDDILLQTVYTVAHEDTLMEMGIHPDTVSMETGQPQDGGRRASAASTSTTDKTSKERTAVKQRMKATQKKYLSAAHDQIWGMLDQFKKKGEVGTRTI